jgi:uncharacterized protein YecE (DUF72 family)
MELFFLERPFYPPNLENSDWLRFYSQDFDYVEIDSSFYRIPNQFMVKNWVIRTPDNFRFTAKFPKVITHDKYLVNVEEDVERFLENIEPLEKKTLALLIQLHPSIEIMQGLEGLRNLLPLLNDRFRYAVEVRHTYTHRLWEYSSSVTHIKSMVNLLILD